MGLTPRPRAGHHRASLFGRLVASLVLTVAFGSTLPATAVLAQAQTAADPSLAPTTRPVPLDEGSRPVRVVVPYFDIDLPVVWSGRKVAGNPPGYPLCDVAQYLISREQGLVLPGQPGTAWIYAHAQPGMFLPLTEAYFANGKTPFRGKLIKLQLRDGRLLTYRITQVDVAHDYDVADRPNQRQQRLVLQTSTGTTGESPRLLLAGRLIDAKWTDEPRPEPRPRACWQAAPAPTPKPRDRTNGSNKATPTPTPTAVPVVEPDEGVDSVTLALGSGAVLLGATLVAVWIIRRP